MPAHTGHLFTSFFGLIKTSLELCCNPRSHGQTFLAFLLLQVSNLHSILKVPPLPYILSAFILRRCSHSNLPVFFKIIFYIYWCTYYLCGGVLLLWHVYRGQRTTAGSWFSPSCVSLGIKSKLSGLVVSAYTHQATKPAQSTAYLIPLCHWLFKELKPALLQGTWSQWKVKEH